MSSRLKMPFATAALAAVGLLLIAMSVGCGDSDPNPKIELATPQNTQGHMPAQMAGAGGGAPPKPVAGGAAGASSQ